MTPPAGPAGYRELAADLAALRKALKMLDHGDRTERDLALKAEVALDRIEKALAELPSPPGAKPVKEIGR